MLCGPLVQGLRPLISSSIISSLSIIIIIINSSIIIKSNSSSVSIINSSSIMILIIIMVICFTFSMKKSDLRSKLHSLRRGGMRWWVHDHWLRQDGGEPSGGEGYLKLPSWYGMLWYSMVWYDIVWYFMVAYHQGWRPLDSYLRLPTWYGMVWYSMVWYGMVCRGIDQSFSQKLCQLSPTLAPQTTNEYCMVWYGMI